jgi:endonuclease/exonuclease/phosphatase family metal-dependent hydrolase
MRWPFVLAFAAATLAYGQNSNTLRVMTFNVRYPSQQDGPNLWESRRDLLVETIRRARPDVMGTQELFHIQGQYIADNLPELDWFGLSRQGNHEDEHMGVFYRKERLRPVDKGDFWLSEAPERPGSMSWGITLPRMVTWAIFEDRRNGRRFRFFNTHFPHRGVDTVARAECAKVLARRLQAVPREEPIVVTGDFNTGAGSDPHTILTRLLQDVWATASRRAGPDATFHGFTGKPRPGRIDWILQRGFRTAGVETITDSSGGRYPSDHFPVMAEFLWP